MSRYETIVTKKCENIFNQKEVPGEPQQIWKLSQ